MQYIVTGAAGHLGNAIVRALAAQGERVLALIHSRGMIDPPPGVTEVEGSVLDPDTMEPLFRDQPEQTVVIHCAGIVSIEPRRARVMDDVNVQGTRNILSLCEARHVRRLVYVSSVHAIPVLPGGETVREISLFDPEKVCGQYAKSKAEATEEVLEYAARGNDACVVHPSALIGPGDYGRGYITQLVIDYCRGALPAGLSDGGYDFADVRDVAQGVVECCADGRSGECYILSGRYYAIRELLNVFHLVTGLKPVRIFLPIRAAKAAAPLLALYSRVRGTPPLYTADSLVALSVRVNFSHEKADAELHYRTRPIEETVRDTVLWLSQVGRIPTAPLTSGR